MPACMLQHTLTAVSIALKHIDLCVSQISKAAFPGGMFQLHAMFAAILRPAQHHHSSHILLNTNR